MFARRLLIFFALFTMTACTSNPLNSNSPTKVTEPLMIAHAGGGYLQQNYTNSLQALDHSYQGGFSYFEMDFSWTSDDQMVCLHDWEKTFKKLFGYKTKQPLSHQEFNELAANHTEFKVCDVHRLADWLKDKPEVKIITDIKYRNLEGIQKIIDLYPTLLPQFIPQFYQPEEYQALKDMGFDELIWILYQYKGSKKSVVELSQEMDLFAVSMRAGLAKNKTLQQLLKSHRIFVYTVNKERSKQKLVNQYGVTGIYTDFLPF